MTKKQTDNPAPGISLLDPAEGPKPPVFQHWGKKTFADLGLDRLVEALSYRPKYGPSVRDILLALCPAPDVITYRQEVLQDFLDRPALAAEFAEVLPLLARLHDSAEARASGYEETLHQTLGRLTELNTYLQVVKKMRQALQAGESGIQSRGLRALAALLTEIEAEETFQALSQSLPGLVAQLHGIPSITIGINLNSELLPVEAVLLSINDKPFNGSSLLDRLVGSQQNRKMDQGIGPLHVIENDFVDGIDGRTVKLETQRDPLMVPLFRDLYKILKSTLLPISKELRRYAQVQAGRLLPLENEIAFYLGAVQLIQRLQRYGLPICRPEVLPVSARETHLTGTYNLLLALHRMAESDGASLREAIVLNEVDFGPQGRIFILTGPNQGGKTVYTQAVGMAYLFFQAGLWVPAQQASLSPLDGIYTHFATEEEHNSRRGRLSEEAQHLSAIFKTLTRHSLVLLNESLASTSPRESLYLSQDLVRALRLYETRAIFATHLHELADDLDRLNTEGQSDSLVVSLVAGVALEPEAPIPENELVTRTYHIKPGPPRGLSYAKGIAHRFGISYEQLAAQKDRGQ